MIQDRATENSWGSLGIGGSAFLNLFFDSLLPARRFITHRTLNLPLVLLPLWVMLLSTCWFIWTEMLSDLQTFAHAVPQSLAVTPPFLPKWLPLVYRGIPQMSFSLWGLSWHFLTCFFLRCHRFWSCFTTVIITQPILFSLKLRAHTLEANRLCSSPSCPADQLHALRQGSYFQFPPLSNRTTDICLTRVWKG